MGEQSWDVTAVVTQHRARLFYNKRLSVDLGAASEAQAIINPSAYVPTSPACAFLTLSKQTA